MAKKSTKTWDQKLGAGLWFAVALIWRGMLWPVKKIGEQAAASSRESMKWFGGELLEFSASPKNYVYDPDHAGEVAFLVIATSGVAIVLLGLIGIGYAIYEAAKSDNKPVEEPSNEIHLDEDQDPKIVDESKKEVERSQSQASVSTSLSDTKIKTENNTATSSQTALTTSISSHESLNAKNSNQGPISTTSLSNTKGNDDFGSGSAPGNN